QQVNRTMLAPSAILDEAHDRTVFAGGIDDDRGDLSLAKGLVGLEPALATDEVIAHLAVAGLALHRDRSLQSELGDAGDDLLEDATVARPRVDHIDGTDGNDFNGLNRAHG